MGGGEAMINEKRKGIEELYEKRNKELREMGIDFYDCEWCHMLNPKGSCTYKTVVVFGTEHTICIDCYNHLKEV